MQYILNSLMDNKMSTTSDRQGSVNFALNLQPTTFIPEFHDEFLINRMSYRRLGDTEMIVSRLGLSGAKYVNLDNHNSATIELLEHTITLSLKGGINFFDTSPCYNDGESERFLGNVLKNVPREAYYIATKVGRYSENDYDIMFDYSSKKIKNSVKNSLEALQVKYIDLVTIQDIEFVENLQIIIHETLPALKELKEKNLIKYIGISSYSIEKLKELIELTDPNIINVIFCNTRLTFFDESLLQEIPFFHENDLGIVMNEISAKGLLTNTMRHSHLGKHPASKDLKQKLQLGIARCDELNIPIDKLATYHAGQCPGIDMCLVDVFNHYELKYQYNAIILPLMANEMAVYKYLRQDLFPKKILNWDEVEPNRYRSFMLARKSFKIN